MKASEYNKAVKDRDEIIKGVLDLYLPFLLGKYQGKGLYRNYPGTFNELMPRFCEELANKIIEALNRK